MFHGTYFNVSRIRFTGCVCVRSSGRLGECSGGSFSGVSGSVSGSYGGMFDAFAFSGSVALRLGDCPEVSGGACKMAFRSSGGECKAARYKGVPERVRGRLRWWMFQGVFKMDHARKTEALPALRLCGVLRSFSGVRRSCRGGVGVGVFSCVVACLWVLPERVGITHGNAFISG